VAEQLVASQEGLSSTKLVSYDVGRRCITHERNKNFLQHFDRKSGIEEKNHLEDCATAGRIMLEKVKGKRKHRRGRGLDAFSSRRRSYSNVTLCSIKRRTFLEWLSDNKLHIKGSASWI
jgi:hypothetical protein